MFRFNTTSTEQINETYGKLNEDQKMMLQQDQMQKRKRETMIPENFQLNFGKWKQSPMGEGDCRRSFIPSLRIREFSNSNVSPDAIVSNSNNKNHWRQVENNNVADNRKRSNVGIQQQQQQCITNNHTINNNHNNNEESDDDDNNSTRTSQPPIRYKTTPRSTDSVHSKVSTHSFNVTDDLNESIHSYFSVQHKKSSTMLDDDCVDDTMNSNDMNTTAVLKNNGYYSQCDSATESSSSKSTMNFIMLLGLLVGLLISKALQYLQLYFKWFQAQVKQLRIAFFGHGSVLDFFNFEDTSRYGVRTKILLLPLVGAFSLLYGVICFLHFLIRFFLTQAPGGLVSFIQKLYTEV